MNDNTKTIWQGHYLQIKNRQGWEYVERHSSTGVVGIIPVTDDNEVVLIEQYRPALDSRVIEFPAGLAGDIPGQENEAMELAAHRELLEETGYEAGSLERLFEGSNSAGLTNEKTTYFLARNLKKVAAGGGDDTEDITIHVIPLAKITEWLNEKTAQGITVDAKVHAFLFTFPR